MSNIRFDYSKALPFVGQHEIDNMAEYVKEAHNMLHNKTGAGNDFLGWVNLPTDYDKEEFERILFSFTIIIIKTISIGKEVFKY